ncbi:MAG TPA: hypothetical protein VFT70_12400 [Nocardioides sp.]|nr:hypothetical protein [Nocardioides sp.]
MNAAVRVAGFGVGLAVVLGVAWAAGAAVGPVVDEPEPMAHAMPEQEGTEAHGAAEHLPGGLAVAQDGYRLELADGVLPAGARTLSFTVLGPDSRPVTAYEVEHEKRLHLIVVRRDFTGFQHVHPVLDEATGEWRTDVDLTPGAWRVLADFVPTGGEDLTLGSDLLVPGRVDAPAPTPEKRTDTVDGYTVTVAGDLESGEHSMLAMSVTRDGAPVDDLQPYLGAAGHLVALREGDLAYLHVHPGDGLEFGAEVPSPGRYHLYLDFKHAGVVRTAELVLEAS